MNSEKNIPQIKAEQVDMEALKERYTAYCQCMRELEQKANADKISRDKAARMGGTVV